jgi:hypothetical protein
MGGTESTDRKATLFGNASGDDINSGYNNKGNVGHDVKLTETNRHVIHGDMGGRGGDSHKGGYAGAGGPAKGNNTFNYGSK